VDSASTSGRGTGRVLVVLAAPVSVVWNIRVQQPLPQLQFWVSSHSSLKERSQVK